MRTRKIKLNPSNAQRRKLDRFAGGARFVYNACVAEKTADYQARRLTRRIFSSVAGGQENPDDIASELTTIVFHNVLAKKKSSRVEWYDSRAYQEYLRFCPWDRREKPQHEDRLAARMTRAIFYPHIHEDLDDVASEFTELVFENVLSKRKRPWKRSRSFQAFREHVQGDQLGCLKYVMRDKFVTAKDNPFYSERPWLEQTPKVIRQSAAFQSAAAYQAAFTNLANGNIKCFDMRFRSKKREQDRGYTLGIEKFVTFCKDRDDAYTLTILPKSIGKIRFFEKPPIDNRPIADCSIHKDGFGDYWLLVPFTRTRTKPTAPRPVLSIDPGVITPFVGYSPNQDARFDGVELVASLDKLHARIAALDKRIEKCSKHAILEHLSDLQLARRRGWRGKQTRTLVQTLQEARKKLFCDAKRVRDDFHWKLANKYAHDHDTILLPKLQTKRLCRGLRAKTNRRMFGIAHGMFLNRLASKCDELGTTLLSPSEAYTTKTCGSCGALNKPNSKDDRVYICGSCGFSAHRDVNAARNIYVKWLTETMGEISSA